MCGGERPFSKAAILGFALTLPPLLLWLSAAAFLFLDVKHLAGFLSDLAGTERAFFEVGLLLGFPGAAIVAGLVAWRQIRRNKERGVFLSALTIVLGIALILLAVAASFRQS